MSDASKPERETQGPSRSEDARAETSKGGTPTGSGGAGVPPATGGRRVDSVDDIDEIDVPVYRRVTREDIDRAQREAAAAQPRTSAPGTASEQDPETIVQPAQRPKQPQQSTAAQRPERPEQAKSTPAQSTAAQRPEQAQSAAAARPASTGRAVPASGDRPRAGQDGDVRDTRDSRDAGQSRDAGDARGDARDDAAGSSLRRSRDLYEMTGRARPRRIEPRRPAPADVPLPYEDPAASGAPAGAGRGPDAGAPVPGPVVGDDAAFERTAVFDGSQRPAAPRAADGTPADARGPVAPAPATRPGATPDRGVGVPDDGTAPTTVMDVPGRRGGDAVPADGPVPAAGYAPTPVAAADGTPVAEPAPEAEADAAEHVDDRRGTLGFGLLLLRLVIGGLLLVRGLQTLFRFGGDPGITALEDAFHAYTGADVLSLALPVAEVVAGGLVILGLVTPLGAALGAVAAGFMTLHNLGTFDSSLWPYAMNPQIQAWGLLAAGAGILVFTGPGTVSADAGRGWSRRPLASAWIFAVVAVVALGVLWYAVGGGNPLT
ncbi:DoxX family membrane protein [Corynebacterium bovis]|uniref:DoxX family membrane protein n=1 Tax=Corynebacterium bovis TaxID=36808 RepID=UPI003138A56D